MNMDAENEMIKLRTSRLFVAQNDDEARLEAQYSARFLSYLAPVFTSSSASPSSTSASPPDESQTLCFAVYTGNTAQRLITPKLCIAKSKDAAVLAHDLDKAVATIIGLNRPDLLDITLDRPHGPPLTPPIKNLAQTSITHMQASGRYNAYCRTVCLLKQALSHRQAAWASVIDHTKEVIDVYVTLRYFWFTISWSGSNKLIAPDVYVDKFSIYLEEKQSQSLKRQIASLADVDRDEMKITLGCPAGLELTMPLHRLSKEGNDVRSKTLHLALKKAWKSLEEHSQLVFDGEPIKPIQLFLSAHTPAAIAVHSLHMCALRCDPVHKAYMNLDTELREHPKVALTAIQLDERGLCLPVVVPRHFLSDKKFVLDALAVCRVVGKCGLVFSCADEKLKNDADVVLAAVTCDGRLLEHMSHTMRASKLIVLAAISNDPRAFKYASAALQSDPDVVAACTL